MTSELANFAARLRDSIAAGFDQDRFDGWALELFALQFARNAAYRKLCVARQLAPAVVEHWSRIPAMPAAAFKELELTCLAPAERAAVFHSSGTAGQRPGRHFHGAESLKVYEASLWPWFQKNLMTGDEWRMTGQTLATCHSSRVTRLVILTPPPAQAPHSSLVHMFETVRQKIGGDGASASRAGFFGRVGTDGAWELDFNAVLAMLLPCSPHPEPRAVLLLGTAFTFVHLLDFLAEKNLTLHLPTGSRVMETGGYKNRSRSLPKAELHKLITDRLGVPASHIVCEYGMSELSSQAYDTDPPPPSPILPPRVFRFPPWARAQIVSPETGREAAEGQAGLIRVLDLANVFSVMAVQTEDLGVRRGDGFELLGRAPQAEPRGCSLLATDKI